MGEAIITSRQGFVEEEEGTIQTFPNQATLVVTVKDSEGLSLKNVAVWASYSVNRTNYVNQANYTNKKGKCIFFVNAAYNNIVNIRVDDKFKNGLCILDQDTPKVSLNINNSWHGKIYNQNLAATYASKKIVSSNIQGKFLYTNYADVYIIGGGGSHGGGVSGSCIGGGGGALNYSQNITIQQGYAYNFTIGKGAASHSGKTGGTSSAFNLSAVGGNGTNSSTTGGSGGGSGGLQGGTGQCSTSGYNLYPSYQWLINGLSLSGASIANSQGGKINNTNYAIGWGGTSTLSDISYTYGSGGYSCNRSGTLSMTGGSAGCVIIYNARK